MKWLLTGWAFQKRKFPFLEEIYAYQEEGRRAAARAGAGAGHKRQVAHAQQRLRPGGLHKSAMDSTLEHSLFAAFHTV